MQILCGRSSVSPLLGVAASNRIGPSALWRHVATGSRKFRLTVTKLTAISGAVALIAVFLFSILIVRASTSSVIELTDATFEHDTQASTGATTGSWFVKFYAPWCGHCKAMTPAWEELAAKLKGKINVAKLDARSNTISAKRFKIQGFPTLLFFHKGKMYEYRGDRSVEKMKAFVEGEWKSADAKEIPQPLSTMDVLKDELISVFQQLQGIVYHAPLPALLLLLLGLLLGCFLVCAVSLLFSKKEIKRPVVAPRTLKKD